ncbi:MAG: hypothetical protein ACRDHU_09255 [Actinomycetota bacterium]
MIGGLIGWIVAPDGGPAAMPGPCGNLDETHEETFWTMNLAMPLVVAVHFEPNPAKIVTGTLYVRHVPFSDPPTDHPNNQILERCLIPQPDELTTQFNDQFRSCSDAFSDS